MNPNCPKCDGLLIQNFDSEGLLRYECTTCKYTVYSNDIQNMGIDNSHSWIKNVFNKNKEEILENNYRFIVVSYLKTIRERRGISQKQIAEIFGFTEQRYGNVERHYNAPSIVLISQFAYVLNVSIGDLYKSLRVSQEIYDDMKYLKIQKSELVQYEELKIADVELNDAELELDRVSKGISDNYKLENKEDLKEVPEYKVAYKDYLRKKNVHDKLVNSTSIFLKQGELVEDTYWMRYLENKDKNDIKNSIKEQEIQMI